MGFMKRLGLYGDSDPSLQCKVNGDKFSLKRVFNIFVKFPYAYSKNIRNQ